ncbi:hypothetical protein BGZ57DRAFT_1010237 [Hyaloscypha finlandica]|nr:hypothetical protein BGZ57DRAFT_1010237 [Hyaloscypha finlandica]
MSKFRTSEPFLYKYSPLTGRLNRESWQRGVQTLWFYGLAFLLSISFGAAGGYLLARHIHDNDGVDTRLTSILHNVPWETVIFEVDERFVSANPGDPNGSIWEELQPSM